MSILIATRSGITRLSAGTRAGGDALAGGVGEEDEGVAVDCDGRDEGVEDDGVAVNGDGGDNVGETGDGDGAERRGAGEDEGDGAPTRGAGEGVLVVGAGAGAGVEEGEGAMTEGPGEAAVGGGAP